MHGKQKKRAHRKAAVNIDCIARLPNQVEADQHNLKMWTLRANQVTRV